MTTTTFIEPFALAGKWILSWGHGGGGAALVEQGPITFDSDPDRPGIFTATREDIGRLEARVFTLSRPLGAAYNLNEQTAISILQTGDNYVAVWSGYHVLTQTPPNALPTGRIQGWWCDGAMGNGPFELHRA